MDRERAFNTFAPLPGGQYCRGPEDRLSNNLETRFCSCNGQSLPEDLDLESDNAAEKARARGIPTLRWLAQWESMSEAARDHYLMMVSYRDLGVNWWQPGELVQFRDFNPCGPADSDPKVVQVVTIPGAHAAEGVKKAFGPASPSPIISDVHEAEQGEEDGTRSCCGSDAGGCYTYNETEKSKSIAAADANKLPKKDITSASSFLQKVMQSRVARPSKQVFRQSPLVKKTRRRGRISGTKKKTATNELENESAEKPKMKGEAEDARPVERSRPPGFEAFTETELNLPGKGQKGDWNDAVYEYYGPLCEKIIDMDHGGDLSKVAFYASSEGGSMMYELPLYLMHKKIRDELEKQKQRGGGKNAVQTVADLAEKVLNTEALRRPFCVAGVWGADVFPRPESVQGARNWQRLVETATICGAHTTWLSGVNTMDQHNYLTPHLTAIFDPRYVLHQLNKIASAGYKHVEAWELPADHTANVLYWSVPASRRSAGVLKINDKNCDWYYCP